MDEGRPVTPRPRRILVTGSRDWTDAPTIFTALRDAKGDGPHILVHGDAQGADRLAAWAAHFLGWEIEAHPAAWLVHGKGAGPIRNRLMVGLGADLCLAFPLGESKGTRGCMRLCDEAGIPVISYEGCHR